MAMTIEEAAASLDPPELALPEGAFGCPLCGKEFGYHVKLTNNLVQLHFQAHVARFFVYLFEDTQIKAAFSEFTKDCEYCRGAKKEGDVAAKFKLHFQVHVTKFFEMLFSDAQIRGSFYRYCETEKNFSTFMKL